MIAPSTEHTHAWVPFCNRRSWRDNVSRTHAVYARNFSFARASCSGVMQTTHISSPSTVVHQQRYANWKWAQHNNIERLRFPNSRTVVCMEEKLCPSGHCNGNICVETCLLPFYFWILIAIATINFHFTRRLSDAPMGACHDFDVMYHVPMSHVVSTFAVLHFEPDAKRQRFNLILFYYSQQQQREKSRKALAIIIIIVGCETFRKLFAIIGMTEWHCNEWYQWRVVVQQNEQRTLRWTENWITFVCSIPRLFLSPSTR